MPDHEQTVAELVRLLERFAGGRQVDEATDLVGDLGLDSIQVMDLLQDVEDRFDVSVPLNVLTDIRTVNDFALQLEALISEQHGDT